MPRVIVDPALRAKLNDLAAGTEFCDETGRTLGVVISPEDFRRMLVLLAESECPYTEEDLRRFEQESGGSPPAEIWQRLGRR
jgi:hypothetical protein